MAYMYLHVFYPCVSKDLAAKKCPRTARACYGLLKPHLRSASDPVWFRPASLLDVLAILQAHPDGKVKLVAGDTGKGRGRREVLICHMWGVYSYMGVVCTL